jgi:hypothetical protein
VLVGALITLDATGSSDPGAGDTLTFEWDFGDGSPSTTGPNVTHTYAASGVYTVTLRVRDDDYPYPTDEGGEMGEVILALQVTVNEAPAEIIDPSLPPVLEDSS